MAISIIGNGNTQNPVAPLNQSLLELQRTLANGIKSDPTSNQAALLAISDRFSSQIQGTNQAILNINDGIATTQIAESGLKELQTHMERLQELSIQSGNATLNNQDRQNLQLEVNQLQQQMSSTLTNTQYNGIPLLTTGTPMTLQTGPNAGDQTTIPLPNLTSTLTSLDITTPVGAQNALTSLTSQMNLVSDIQSSLGAEQAGLAATANSLLTSSSSLTDSNGRIVNADIALAASNMTSMTIRNQASVAILAQANQTASQVQNLL